MKKTPKKTRRRTWWGREREWERERDWEWEQMVATSRESRCILFGRSSSWFMAGSLHHSHRHWRRHYLAYLYKCFRREALACHAQRSPPCVCVRVCVPGIGIYKSINEIYTHILCYVLENLLDFCPGRVRETERERERWAGELRSCQKALSASVGALATGNWGAPLEWVVRCGCHCLSTTTMATAQVILWKLFPILSDKRALHVSQTCTKLFANSNFSHQICFSQNM